MNLAKTEGRTILKFCIVKKILTTFALAFALCGAVNVSAHQHPDGNTHSKVDTVLLSETTDGDYLVRRILLKTCADDDYSVYYAINSSLVNSNFDNNDTLLKELDCKLCRMAKNAKVEKISITGYASPDGCRYANQQLAEKRATQIKEYIAQKYPSLCSCNIELTGTADMWGSAVPLVEACAVPEKDAVLEILRGRQTPAQKEAALKRHPAAWNYLKENILPQLRKTDIDIRCDECRIIEEKTLIRKPAQKPQPQPETVTEEVTIVEVPMSHKTEKELKREAREAEKLAKHEMREARKIARAEEKAARKIAKKERKAAKKAAAAARKVEKAASKM